MQSEVISHYREIRKENRKLLRQMQAREKQLEKKMERQEIMQLLKHYIDLELMGNEITHFDNTEI